MHGHALEQSVLSVSINLRTFNQLGLDSAIDLISIVSKTTCLAR